MQLRACTFGARSHIEDLPPPQASIRGLQIRMQTPEWHNTGTVNVKLVWRALSTQTPDGFLRSKFLMS